MNLGIQNGYEGAITIHCNYQAIITSTKDLKYHTRTKHIDTKYNYVRVIIAKREVIVQYLSTYKMVADPLTKPIPRDIFLTHVNSLGLRGI